MEEQYKDELEAILKDCGGIVRLTIHNYVESLKYPNAEYIINVLINEGLVVEVESDMRTPYLKLTSLGTTVLKGSGYNAYKEKIRRKEIFLQEKDDLELQQLKQSVKINKWQFWVMILGGFGGIVSFFILVWQFFYGSGSFFENFFK